jgi:hypothetical protein
MKLPVSTFVLVLWLSATPAFAGGPLVLGGPTFGVEGQAFTWDAAAMPIKYQVDGGPMAVNGNAIVIDNATGLSRVQSMFNHWQSVPTTSISYSYAGPIQATGAFGGGDVQTVAQFNAVIASCNSGGQNPIMFDANGSIVHGLGLDPDIIGFAAPCKLDSTTGHIDSGFALLNGQFQDSVIAPPNYELTTDQFDEAITHELGHFSGLDHSQINVDVIGGEVPDNCNTDTLAGLPLMFPVAYCQSRASAGLPILSPDDVAWISHLYPAANITTSYGIISGYILFSDGSTHAQDLNVIARQVDDPNTPQDESRRVAISVVSGYRFTGNPGQSITGDNTGGSNMGSRDPKLIGYYDIPVPPGTYTVEIENISPSFTGGSGLGPIDPPIQANAPHEFWTTNQTGFNDFTKKDPINVAPGQTVNGINIILNGTPPRFDQFEDGGADLLPRQLFVVEQAVAA